MFLLSFLVVLLISIVVFRYRRRRMYELASLVPTSKDEKPVIGLAHTLLGNTEDIMNILQRYSYVSMANNGIMRAWLNHILYFVVVNPVDVEIILKTCLEKDDLHRFIRNVIGNGGIFAPVSIWRSRRKTLLPTFSPKVIETFVEVFSEQADKLSRQLEPQAGRDQFSIWPYINSYTLDSVLETTMGVKINALGNLNSPFLNAMNNIMNLICERIFHLWLQPNWLYKFFPQSRKHEKYLKELHAFTDKMIQDKRDELKNGQNFQPESDYNFDFEEDCERKTFLDLLISLSGGEKGYNNVELREEILTLIVAGTDTSAVVISYTLLLLAKYPKVQETIINEINEVFGDSDRLLEKDDLLKLKYLERVVKESLRLFPPAPFIIRKVLEEIKLPSSGFTLPAGSGVAISIWGIHRDPKYWGSDAEVFDPDRFLPERFNLKHACSYMPFSNGPRNCLDASENAYGACVYARSINSQGEILVRLLMAKSRVAPIKPTTIPRLELCGVLLAVRLYEKAINRLLNLVCERIFHLWLQPDWMYKLFPQYHEHEKYVGVVHGFTDKVIKDKHKELENKNKYEKESQSYDLNSYKKKDFLDLLISLSGGKQGYNDVELREEVLMITVAGMDTSAVATGYTLKLLGKYPKIQDKVYIELLEVFGDSDYPLVKEDLAKLKYLERVIKESLRLFPPVPFVIRKVLEDTKLPSGYTLPGGSGVVVCIWGVHRDPKYWGPDAEVFDPDRFLPERFKLQHACSFMPFSNGPRNCLGYQYAIMSLKTSISTILRWYRVVGEEELTNVPRIRVKLDIMMKAVDGYQIALEKR